MTHTCRCIVLGVIPYAAASVAVDGRSRRMCVTFGLIVSVRKCGPMEDYVFYCFYGQCDRFVDFSGVCPARKMSPFCVCFLEAQLGVGRGSIFFDPTQPTSHS